MNFIAAANIKKKKTKNWRRFWDQINLANNASWFFALKTEYTNEQKLKNSVLKERFKFILFSYFLGIIFK